MITLHSCTTALAKSWLTAYRARSPFPTRGASTVHWPPRSHLKSKVPQRQIRAAIPTKAAFPPPPPQLATAPPQYSYQLIACLHAKHHQRHGPNQPQRNQSSVHVCPHSCACHHEPPGHGSQPLGLALLLPGGWWITRSLPPITYITSPLQCELAIHNASRTTNPSSAPNHASPRPAHSAIRRASSAATSSTRA